jgi:hypothetical protein
VMPAKTLVRPAKKRRSNNCGVFTPNVQLMVGRFALSETFRSPGFCGAAPFPPLRARAQQAIAEDWPLVSVLTKRSADKSLRFGGALGESFRNFGFCGKQGLTFTPKKDWENHCGGFAPSPNRVADTQSISPVLYLVRNKH